MVFFKEDYLEFFKDLAANNEREWFHSQKVRFDHSVKKPFELFVGYILTSLSKSDQRYSSIAPKHCIFRIHRDVRFSADKSPYKLHMSAQISPFGKGSPSHPGFYIQIGPEEVFLAGGSYMPDKQQLQRIREAIIKNPQSVNAILSDPDFVDFYGGLAESEKNKILPKDLKEYAATLPILFQKQYFFAKTLINPKEVLDKKFIELVLRAERIGRPWNQFITGALE